MLNALKVNRGLYPYYPIALSIANPQATLDYYRGKLIIMVIVDFDVLLSTLRSKEIDYKILEEEEYFLELKVTSGKKSAFMKVSRSFLGKVGYEFLSLRWMADYIAEIALSRKGDNIHVRQ
jgi:hypothetical protein